jgi:oxidoreductase, gfo/idh/mocA family
LYRNFALALRSILAGEEPAPETLDFPSAEDGVRGMRFIETIVATGSTENKWIKIID